MSLQALVDELASGRLDSQQSAKRRETMIQAMALLDASDGATVLAEMEVPKCGSGFASHRIAQLYIHSLFYEGIDRKLIWTKICNLLSQAEDGKLVVQVCKDVKATEVDLQLLLQLSQEQLGAAVMGFLLTKEGEKLRLNFLDALLQQSLQSQVATPSQMRLCQGAIQNLTQTEWVDSVMPLLEKKVKASPEKVLPTVQVILEDLSGNTRIDWETLGEDLWSALAKHLKSAKLQNIAKDCLIPMTQLVPLAIASSITGSTLPTVQEQRENIYQILSVAGQNMLGKHKAHDEAAVSAIVSTLSTALDKEIKSREAGLQALVPWIAVAKRYSVTWPLEYFRKTLNDGSGGDLVQRIGAIILHLDSVELQESLILDVLQSSQIKPTLVENANKKATAVNCVEGLLILYLSLVHSINTKSKLVVALDKVLSAGTEKTTDNFLYSTSMTDLLGSHLLVRHLLPRTITRYVKYRALHDETGSLFQHKSSPTAASRTLACCLAHPTNSDASIAYLSNIQTYDSGAVESLTQALFFHVNAASCDYELELEKSQASREAREAYVPAQPYQKICLRLDGHAIRRAALALVTPTAYSHILLHFMTSGRGRQRKRLDVTLTDLIRQVTAEQLKQIAVDVAGYACNGSNSDEVAISQHVHEAAKSWIATVGMIASSFDPSLGIEDPEDEGVKPHAMARQICVEVLGPQLHSRLLTALQKLEELTEDERSLYKTSMGTLWTASTEDNKEVELVRRAKGRGGGTLEDEEWERKMKKELAAKRKDEISATICTPSLTLEQRKQVDEQDKVRRKLRHLIEGEYLRTLTSINDLCLSDIEVGNACLSILGETVLRVAITDVGIDKMNRANYDALKALASCVYELDEDLVPSIAMAIIACCKVVKANEDDKGTVTRLVTTALPSSCTAAGAVISEIDDFDDCLSGQSFSFLFPIIRASLTGPRNVPGCEGALRVLDRHTAMLAGEECDSAIKRLRKDMAATVLELLSHDRAQTFTDPTPYDVLAACYRTDGVADTDGPVLSTAELAPLLGDVGALGSRNCRVGSLLALTSIASKHPSLVKNNPLVESRIWMNCFDIDDKIQEVARSAWRTLKGDIGEGLPSPSPVYALPLLPLLSHSDSSIALAAGRANAVAMGVHPSTVQRNIAKLCSTYIESYATAIEGEKKSSAAPPIMPLPLSAKTPSVASAVPPARKAIPTGLPKRKPVVKKTDALSLAGIGKPKTGGGGRSKVPAKKKLDPSILKPKEERTFDREILESQFKVGDKKEESFEKDSPEKVAVRKGMLNAVACITDPSTKVSLDMESLKLLSSLLMVYGLADLNDDVRSTARNALRDVVATFGSSEEAIAFLLPTLEGILSSGTPPLEALGALPSDKILTNVTATDRRKEGAVVALGSVALHLKGPENEQKIDSTIDMLVAALDTPSESVQSSVAECLAKLMKKGRTQERLEDILNSLLRDCLNGGTRHKRRGAAHGISAAVKGSGIASLKKYEIVKQLEEACDSGTQNNKEGSLFAIELLSARLGLLFEPYVIQLLPSLLKAFSDSSDHVRSAAAHTAELIMSKLSAHGVKLVMPAVLTAFNDPAWRTKQASIQMLGSMSHLAPKQLAGALPKVVPKLTEAFGDTHPKVKNSAQEALNEISKVVKNPEISSISAILLNALTEPSEGTSKALEALIETEFLHAIDAPSLALIVPILHRGLRDRVATTKRYGALITGNICTMINDPKDFLPYLPILLPDLQLAVLDPIPDVRSTSGKAIGSLTRGLGEVNLPELRTWLIVKLRDETVTSAERSGAAQGLTELLVAGGSEVVENVIETEILPLRSHPQASTREGVLWVLTFLPSSMGQSFTPLIDISLPALISGLSDESEPVREVAMRAGRVIIRTHGKTHVNKILPSLERGLTDEDYRIRVASLTLLGDLLSMIGGTAVVKGETETQEDIRRAEKAQAQIALALGPDTRKRVLSGLYLARSDTTAVVRQSAVQVWKTVVSVTGRTLRDILPVLVSQIVDALASGDPERTQVAGRCLGDIVNKLGDSVLPEIIPVLRNALYDGDRHTRRGVCVGLSEVIKCSTRDQILRFIEIIVKVVQDALCDEDEGVRATAATCFSSLHNVVGSRAMDEIVPSLLVSLEYGDEKDASIVRALNGLTGILSTRSRELLPYIIPRLLKQPISENHAKALSGIAEVTSTTLQMHFHAIIPALISDLSARDQQNQDEVEKAVRNCARSVCRCVDESGVNWLVSEIASKCGSDKAEIRRESCWMFQTVVEERKDKADFDEHIPIMLRELICRLNDDIMDVLKANQAALSVLTTHVPAEELVKHIDFVRNMIASMVSDARRRKGGVGDGEFLMPGFNIPKGLDPLLPIYQRGILYGTPSVREVSASGLGELIALTSSKYLAGQLVIKMTGPLLRIVGDRNPAEVKIAILRTLGMILVKGGPALKAFVPQFQTTFVKALSDQSRQVRLEAIKALGLLMPLSTRVDPLIKELVVVSLGKVVVDESGAVAAVQTATLEALAVVLKEGGTKAKLPESVPSALDASKELLKHPDEGVREAAAKVMGVSCLLLGPEVTAEVVESEILSSTSTVRSTEADTRHGKACASQRILASMGSHLSTDLTDQATDLLISYCSDDSAIVKEAACVALGAAMGSGPPSRRTQVEPVLLKLMKSTQERMEVHKAIANGLCIALSIIQDDKIDFLGKTLLDACLGLAMSGSQRVQYAYNDVLWLALSVIDGDEAGLERYLALASFDNAKTMKALHSKVLSRIKSVDVDL